MRVMFNGRRLIATDVHIEVIQEEDAVVFTVSYPTPIDAGNLVLLGDFIENTNQEYKLTIPIFNSKGTQVGLFVQTYDNRISTLQLTPDTFTEVKQNNEGVFAQFFELGIHHILLGFDHLIFLLGLLVVCRRWKDAAIIITCFTLAHSVTLSLAALKLVAFPPKWTEVIIALSIVYVGLENLWTKHKAKFRWILTSLFGLIHGLGFANVLVELGLGSGENASVVIPLLSFNLGVETGQIGLAIVALPLMWYLHKFKWYTAFLLPCISVVLVLTGGYWAFDRLA